MYFYTHMKHEIQLSLFDSFGCGDPLSSAEYLPGAGASQSTILNHAFAEVRAGGAQPAQGAEHSRRRHQGDTYGRGLQPGAFDRQRVQHLVAPPLEQLERLLSRLRSGALVLALLAYGLRLPISALRNVRVRDVDPVAGTIVVGLREYVVPSAVADDLRELHQERLSELKCSYAQSAFERRAQPFFTPESVEVLYHEVAAWWDTVQGASPEERVEASARVTSWSSCRILDRGLSLLGWRHLRAAQDSARSCKARSGAGTTRTGTTQTGASPLDLFDKGPRFVRRTYAGVVHAYYLWRARAVSHVGAVLAA